MKETMKDIILNASVQMTESCVCVVLLVLMVQAFQSVGTLWATKSDKRLRK